MTTPHEDWQSPQRPIGPTFDGPVPPKQSKKRFIIPAAMLLGGMVIGGAAVGGAAVGSEPPPARGVTPPECIKALDLAGDAMGQLEVVPKLWVQSMEAASDHDAVALHAITEKVNAASDQLKAGAPALGVAVSGCRDKAK